MNYDPFEHRIYLAPAEMFLLVWPEFDADEQDVGMLLARARDVSRLCSRELVEIYTAAEVPSKAKNRSTQMLSRIESHAALLVIELANIQPAIELRYINE